VAPNGVEFRAGLALNEEAELLRLKRPVHGGAFELDELFVAGEVDRERLNRAAARGERQLS